MNVGLVLASTVALVMLLPGSGAGAGASSVIGGTGAQPAAQPAAHANPCAISTYVLQGTGKANASTNWKCTFTDQAGIPHHAAAPKQWEIDNTVAHARNYLFCVFGTQYVGNTYWIYTSFDGQGFNLSGATPQVPTGSQLVAPTYDSYWSGSGVTQSSGCVAFTLAPAEYVYIGVLNSLWLRIAHDLKTPCDVTTVTLLHDGCTVSGISMASAWEPGKFTIRWYSF